MWKHWDRVLFCFLENQVIENLSAICEPFLTTSVAGRETTPPRANKAAVNDFCASCGRYVESRSRLHRISSQSGSYCDRILGSSVSTYHRRIYKGKWAETGSCNIQTCSRSWCANTYACCYKWYWGDYTFQTSWYGYGWSQTYQWRYKLRECCQISEKHRLNESAASCSAIHIEIEVR